MHEYDKIADWYTANRSRDAGVPDVTAFARTLSPEAKILDLGCGNGIPIARSLILNGFDVYGIDSSQEMVSRFRINCPQAHTECATIQNSGFFNTIFDGVVAWGVLFHLTEMDQELAISRVSSSLKPFGKFLFTAAKQEGTVESKMNGIRFRYFSLGAVAYRALLHKHGLEVVDEHADDWDNYVFITRKLPD